MSITFDIINISIENLTETEKVLLISFFFEYKLKNITWKFEKAYDVIIFYFNELINKVPNLQNPPLIRDCNNNTELYKQKLKEYIINLFNRKEIYNLFSFQKFFEFPDELIEKQIIIDSLSNVTEYNILDFYYDDPYLFVSCGNSNSLRALSFLFSYFEVKGFYLTYKMNNLPGSYGEKKLTELSKIEGEKYITKIKKIKDFLFLGYNNGNFEIFNFNNEKKEPTLYSKIDNIESKMSINENFKIANIFFKSEKGLVYAFIEKDKKVCIYEINSNNHIKDIELTDNAIIYSYISFDMNRIFVIDSYGTFWMFELNEENYTVKLLQASYTKLHISTSQIFKEKNNDQTINIFVGVLDKVYLYQYSNKNNNFTLKLTCDIRFKLNYILYVDQYKCLMIGCDNGTIQIWKDSSKSPEYIIESGYSTVDKLFYDVKNKYFFINCNKNLKIIEIDLEKIFINENGEKEQVIADTLKDEEDKVAQNNIRLLSKAFQTPQSSPNKSKNEIDIEKSKDNNIGKKNDKKNNLDSINKDTEDESNKDENDLNYEVRNIDILDGWNEW